MKAQTTSHSRRCVRKVFLPNIFQLSTYLGLFPFVCTGCETIISLWFIPSCAFHLAGGIFYMVQFGNSSKIYFTFVENSKFTELWLFVGVGLFMIPVVSIANIALNLKKFSKMLYALTVVENETKNYPPGLYSWLTVISGSFIMLLCFYEYYFVDFWVSLQLYLGLLMIFIILSQFQSLASLITCQYTFLSQTLCEENAVVWTQCHEVLGACCNILMKCYSPQLLIIVGVCFAYFVNGSFIFIRSTQIHNHILSSLIYSLYLLFNVYIIWFIIFCCDNIVQKDRKFDKLLYKLVLDDPTKDFLKNKRIMHHFKAKRRVEFSVMGFFNFDYVFLCSMASIATTYTVILIQFSN